MRRSPGFVLGAALVLGLALTPGPAGAAAVYFDAAANALRVIGYPAQAPCTPALLAALDRQHGWNRVRRDAAGARTVVEADLVIGFHDGSETWFQVGDSNRAEILEIRGNVAVSPVFIPGVNRALPRGVEPPGRNRLTLGHPAAPGLTNALLIASSSNAWRTLYVGRSPGGSGGVGGEFQAWFARVGPAAPGLDGLLGAPGRRTSGAPGAILGQNPVLVGAHLSGMDGFFLASLGKAARIENTVVERGRAGFYNCISPVEIVGCVFRDLEVAVLDGGSMNLTLRDCRLENCRRNWVAWYTANGLTLVDCDWTPPPDGDELQSWVNKNTGKRQFPSVVSRRHVQVQVRDPAGQPVAGAAVSVASEQQDWTAAEPPRLTTDRQGLTPGRGAPRALLLTEFQHRAIETGNQPAVTECTFAIEARAPGYAPGRVAGIRPRRSWAVIPIVLTPQPGGAKPGQ